MFYDEPFMKKTATFLMRDGNTSVKLSHATFLRNRKMRGMYFPTRFNHQSLGNKAMRRPWSKPVQWKVSDIEFQRNVKFSATFSA